MRINAWRTDRPEPGRVVWVYYINGWILAQWDGRNYVTVDDRRVLVGVTHWLPRETALG